MNESPFPSFSFTTKQSVLIFLCTKEVTITVFLDNYYQNSKILYSIHIHPEYKHLFETDGRYKSAIKKYFKNDIRRKVVKLENKIKVW